MHLMFKQQPRFVQCFCRGLELGLGLLEPVDLKEAVGATLVELVEKVARVAGRGGQGEIVQTMAMTNLVDI
jgi:hypothetical protein